MKQSYLASALPSRRKSACPLQQPLQNRVLPALPGVVAGHQHKLYKVCITSMHSTAFRIGCARH
jgi:hypothetical protein